MSSSSSCRALSRSVLVGVYIMAVGIANLVAGGIFAQQAAPACSNTGVNIGAMFFISGVISVGAGLLAERMIYAFHFVDSWLTKYSKDFTGNPFGQIVVISFVIFFEGVRRSCRDSSSGPSCRHRRTARWRRWH